MGMTLNVAGWPWHAQWGGLFLWGMARSRALAGKQEASGSNATRCLQASRSNATPLSASFTQQCYPAVCKPHAAMLPRCLQTSRSNATPLSASITQQCYPAVCKPHAAMLPRCLQASRSNATPLTNISQDQYVEAREIESDYIFFGENKAVKTKKRATQVL